MAFTAARIAEHLNISENKAATVLGLIRGSVDPFSIPTVEAWRRQCFNPPATSEAIMLAIDATIGTFGVEVIQGNDQGGFYRNCVAEYCNAGDTYAATILHDHVAGKYRLTTMGDFVERFDRRYGIK